MFLTRVKDFCSKWIVLEPLIILFSMVFMNGVTMQDIYLEKIKTMDNQTNTTDDELQKETSDFIRNTMTTQTAISVLVLLISGPLSDKYGRKFGILWTVGLTGLANISFGVLYFIDRNNIYEFGIDFYYIPIVILGLSGGNFNFFLAVFSYIGDLSNLMPETRLKRFTFSEASISIGIIIGFFSGGLITEYLGNLYVFVVCTLLCFVAFLYGALRIQNIVPGKVEENEETEHEKKITERILSALSTPFKRREGSVRLKIMLLCTIFILQEMPWMFDDILMVLYTKDKFNWSPEALLDFKSVFWILINLGDFLCFPFLVKCLSLPLMLVGCLTTISRAGYYGLVATCSKPYCLYIAAVVNCLGGVQSIIVRSSLAAELPPTELGTIFGILEILVAMVPLAVAPLASWIYNLTLDVYPGSWALVSMVILVGQLPFFLGLFFVSVGNKQEE